MLSYRNSINLGGYMRREQSGKGTIGNRREQGKCAPIGSALGCGDHGVSATGCTSTGVAAGPHT